MHTKQQPTNQNTLKPKSGEHMKSVNATANTTVHAAKDCHVSKSRKCTNAAGAEMFLSKFELSSRCTCY